MDELIEGVKPDLHHLLDKALNSGVLSEDITHSNDYVLSKIIFTLYMRHEPYSPLTERTKKEMALIYRFLY
jgi:hypothetical protein